MEDISSFVGFNILPNEKVRICAPEDSLYSMTAVSILPDEKTPEKGRVVVYVETQASEKEEAKSVAIAALRVGVNEVVNVDYILNRSTPLTLYTKGDAITVSVTGTTSATVPLSIEKLEKK